MKNETEKIRGLLLVEWAVVAYTLFTLVLMAFYWPQLEDPASMLTLRAGAMGLLLALWALYRLRPCKLTHFLRPAGQMSLLGIWYPDTYELNRILPNLDHVFASLEQTLFGGQPAISFSAHCTSPWFSELLSLAYVSYFPLIAIVVVYYFFCVYRQFDHTVFVIMASFFLFYVVFIFLPVTGPQYYYQAIGLDAARQGVFPDVADYFRTHHDALPIPGWDKGLFHYLVAAAHTAGERPTAAFPSSHIGITTILVILAWKTRCAPLFYGILVMLILMFFATFYLQAHYLIDAIAGIPAGIIIYLVSHRLARALGD